MSFQEKDRSPLARLKAPVDPIGLSLDGGDQVLIPLDVGATRRPEFHKGKFPLELRVFLQKPLDASQTFKQSFGIVEAINAHG